MRLTDRPASLFHAGPKVDMVLGKGSFSEFLGQKLGQERSRSLLLRKVAWVGRLALGGPPRPHFVYLTLSFCDSLVFQRCKAG